LKNIDLKDFVKRVTAAPLGVYEAHSDSFRTIPAAVEPLVVKDHLWAALRADTRPILTAVDKVAKWLVQEAPEGLSKSVFKEFTGLEQEAAFRRLEPGGGLVTARLDLFFDGEDLKVIEVNATIPAMQAYSDMIKESYVAAQGARYDEGVYGSNTKDLLLSLLAHYAATGGRKNAPHIGIIARTGDSQLAELRWLKSKWEAAGYPCTLGCPEEVTLSGTRLVLAGIPLDVTYRHIFANRLAPGSAFAQACARSRAFQVFNPVSAHLEAKGVLAECSRIVEDEEISDQVGLSLEERSAVGRRVPWTRLIVDGPGHTPDGEWCANILSWIKTHQAQVVVKGNLGYGGHAVAVGDQFSGKDGQGREVSWSAFVDRCASGEHGLWLVQAKVEGRKIDNCFIRDDQINDQQTYVDCSIFANLGVDFQPSGGASRFSSHKIVNIGQGGGMMPLFLDSQINKLHKAIQGVV
jgi:hypothetical protein